MVLADFGTGQVFWSMLWFFLFFIWIWLLIVVFSDIFRSHDMGGFVKFLWILFVIVMPYLGVFVYLIARGNKMSQHAVEDAQLEGARGARVLLEGGDDVDRRLCGLALLYPADRRSLGVEVHDHRYMTVRSEIARQIDCDGRLAGPAFGVQDDDTLHDVLMFYPVRVTRVAAKPTHAPMRLQAAAGGARV